MDADRASGASGVSVIDMLPPAAGISWMIRAGLAVAGLLSLAVVFVSNPLLSGEEARHAGIVYDMWAARQYLVPRVDGLPVLDGAPLYYWLAVASISLFGVHEWTLRLPSLISALLVLWVVSCALKNSGLRLRFAIVLGLGLVQPGLMVAGRIAAPDMLNILLLALALGGFAQAADDAERGLRRPRGVFLAWCALGLLALGAGLFAILVPLGVITLWLALRKRLGLVRMLWTGPALTMASLLVLPWWWFVSVQYPGIVSAMMERQALEIVGLGSHGWMQSWLDARGLLVLASIVPLAACAFRLRSTACLAVMHTPTAGLMAIWLVVFVPFYPLLTMSRAGPAVMMAVPLLYFAAMALGSHGGRPRWGTVRVCWAHLAVASAAVITGVHFFTVRSSEVVPLTQVIGKLYLPAIDKVIMLDRYDYEFNFYMRSPKLVSVVADWTDDGKAAQPDWKQELRRSAPYAPETAKRLLLTSQGFHDRICERRVVNLWIVGTQEAALQHPVMADLTAVSGTGDLQAWYLSARTTPAQC